MHLHNQYLPHDGPCEQLSNPWNDMGIKSTDILIFYLAFYSSVNLYRSVTDAIMCTIEFDMTMTCSDSVLESRSVTHAKCLHIPCIIDIENIKTTSMETVSTGVLGKNKEHYLRSKDKAEKRYDVSRPLQLQISKYKKNEIILSIMSNLQPNCCLKVDFQKVDQHAGGKWLIHDTKRRKDNQLQSLKLPCRISKLSS